MIATFASPADVEAAFYDAIARADLRALMSVWADDEDIVCIRPTGQRLSGTVAIRDSWRGVFASNARLAPARASFVDRRRSRPGRQARR